MFAQRRAKEQETSLRAQAETLVDPLIAKTRPKYEAMITAQAQSLAAAIAPTAKSEAEARALLDARLQPFIDAKITEAKADVTAQVEAALKSRIDAARTLVTDEANKMAESMAQSTIVGPMTAVQRAFDAMLSEVELRVGAARQADSPARRAAADVRVRLAMKATDVYLAQARTSIEAARSELAALKAANPSASDADALLRQLDTSRAKLESDLRFAANAGDESAFTAAYIGFESGWRAIAAQVDAAAGVWTPERVCQQASAALQNALTQAEAASSDAAAARASLGGVVPAPQQAQSFDALRQSLEATQGKLTSYASTVREAQQQCAVPGSDPRALIARLDAVRQQQDAARQAYETSRLLAQSVNR